MIALEKFTEADIERLISWIPSEKFLLQWAGPAYNFPLDATQIKQHLEKSSGDSPSCLIFKAVDGETGHTVGHCELFLDHKNQFATIGRVLVGSTEQRGRGLGQQIMRAALKIAFDDLSLHRVELWVFEFNKGAIACYKKVGFQTEGFLRECRKRGDEYWSLCGMSILENEWRELQTI